MALKHVPQAGVAMEKAQFPGASKLLYLGDGTWSMPTVSNPVGWAGTI